MKTEGKAEQLTLFDQDIWCGKMCLMPQIQQVVYTDKNGDRLTLEEECMRSETLPSLAYGFKRCSLKHKISIQDKVINNTPAAREVWKAEKKITKFIGFDAGEQRRKQNACPCPQSLYQSQS